MSIDLVTRDRNNITYYINTIAKYEYAPVSMLDHNEFVHIDWGHIQYKFPIDYLADSPEKYALLTDVLLANLQSYGVGIMEWQESTLSSIVPRMAWINTVNLTQGKIPTENYAFGMDRLLLALKIWKSAAESLDWPTIDQHTYEVVMSNNLFNEEIIHTSDTYSAACRLAKSATESTSRYFGVDYVASRSQDNFVINLTPPTTIAVRVKSDNAKEDDA